MPEQAKMFDPGIGLGFAAAVAIHYRHAIRRWFSRLRRSSARTRRPAPEPMPRRPLPSRSREQGSAGSRTSRTESRERLLAR
jgi:hypothetical protein